MSDIDQYPHSLPEISGTVTQDMIDDYAEVSGDYNPLHVDPDFAKKTQFGGIIAHGPLATNFLLRSLTDFFDGPSLFNVSVDITYTGPVSPGDRVVARGSVERSARDIEEGKRAAGYGECRVDGESVLNVNLEFNGG